MRIEEARRIERERQAAEARRKAHWRPAAENFLQDPVRQARELRDQLVGRLSPDTYKRIKTDIRLGSQKLALSNFQIALWAYGRAHETVRVRYIQSRDPRVAADAKHIASAVEMIHYIRQVAVFQRKERERQAAEARRKEQERQAAEARRKEQERQAAEARRKEQERQAAEARRKEQERQAAEAQRKERERQAAEARRKQRERQAAEAHRKKQERQAAEARRKEKERKAAELRRREEQRIAEAKRNRLISASSGSGFAVSPIGHVVTNNHVISGCQKVVIHHKGQSVLVRVLAFDPQNDLAVLKGDFRPSTVLKLSANRPELLQDIYVAGYPFGQRMSRGVKVTKGIISSLTGIGNNFSNIQIDAALQPGNSGGPIVDEKGNVVGVAVAKLDIKKILKDYGTLPENTNFGVKTSVVKSMLDSNNIDLPRPRSKAISKTDLGRLIDDGTFYLSCLMTRAQIKKLKSKKVLFKNLD